MAIAHEITKSANRRYWDSTLHKSVSMVEMFNMYRDGDAVTVQDHMGNDITLETLFKSMTFAITNEENIWKILRYASTAQ